MPDGGIVHAGLERLPLGDFRPTTCVTNPAQLRKALAQAAINRLLGWRLGERASHVVIVQGSKEAIHVLAGIDALGFEVPVKIQPRRIHLATAQLQQRRDVGTGGRDVESRRLRRCRRRGLQRQLRLGQLASPVILGHQAIGLGVIKPLEQLADILTVRPGRAVIAMRIEIQDHPGDIHPSMFLRGQQWRE
ncbi:hypothetical protein D3C76_1116100 [compost metagenome]